MNTFTLITGASEGLGVEFAKQAAREKRGLIIAARSEDKLNDIAYELRGLGVEVVVIPADLNTLEGAEDLWVRATEGRVVDVLVNNAGLGFSGSFADPEGWERELSSINVNMLAVTRLMKLAILHMKEHGKGRFLNIASTAAFMPGPNMAVYHATKAYVLSLSEAVAEELRDTKITVTAICPGATKTNFHNQADMHDVRLLQMAKPAKASEVAELGWLQSRIGKRIVVPGAINNVYAFSTRFLPRGVNTRIPAQLMGKD